MHRHDGLSAMRDRRVNHRCSYRVCLSIHIHQDRRCASVGNSKGRGYKAVRDGYHFIAMTDFVSPESQLQGRHAAVDTNGVFDPTKGGKLLLENFNLAA